MQVCSLLFKLEGRINRAMFWIGTGISMVLVCALLLVGLAIDSAITDGKTPSLFGNFWVLAAFSLYVWMSFALCTKRFHDHDSSGWWCLILPVPAVGALFFIIELGMMKGTAGDNRYGPDPAG